MLFEHYFIIGNIAVRELKAMPPATLCVTDLKKSV